MSDKTQQDETFEAVELDDGQLDDVAGGDDTINNCPVTNQCPNVVAGCGGGGAGTEN